MNRQLVAGLVCGPDGRNRLLKTYFGIKTVSMA